MPIPGFDLATLARERIEIAILDRLIQRGLRADELAFIIPRRTLAHRRPLDERLALEESIARSDWLASSRRPSRRSSTARRR